MKTLKSFAASVLIVGGFAGLFAFGACLLQASVAGAELCGLIVLVAGGAVASITS